MSIDPNVGRQPLSTIYGASYFGSGGSGGWVWVCDNCRTDGWRDNGFCSGPDAVQVCDPTAPASYEAKGWDCIGDGRRWLEWGVWSPLDQKWTVTHGK